jgi:chromosome segregation ATPase
MNQQLAEARRRFEEATEKHRTAQERVAQIRERIATCERRQREITAARLEGESSPAEAAEYMALTGDIETLKAVLSEAECEARALEPTSERNYLTIAERNAAQELTQAEFDALRDVAARLDVALCDAIAKLHAVGRRMGHVQLSQSWRASDDLRRAVYHNVPPGGR